MVDSLGVLAPLSRGSKLDAVCEAIYRFVRDAGGGPGDPLPPEGEFAERLDVSKVVVREAVSQLQGLGIVDRRHGVGLRVGPCGLAVALERPFRLLGSTPDGMMQLIKLRIALEIGNAWLNFDKMANGSVGALQGICDRMESASEGACLDELDFEFHAVLGADNECAAQLAELVRSWFDVESGVARSGRWLGHQTGPEAATDHRRMVSALRDGDKERFMRELHSHLALNIDLVAGLAEGEGTARRRLVDCSACRRREVAMR